MAILTHPKFNTSLEWSQDELIFLEKNKNAVQADIFLLLKEGSAKLVHQIFARQKAKQKLSFLSSNEKIVYPQSLNLEQCSSEKTANFKASLFSGKKFIDLSGGLGIDSYFFSKQFDSGIVIERDTELAHIVAHNFFLLNQLNVQFAIGENAEQFIKSCAEKCDLIYIDPARRNSVGNKIVTFSECEPNVISMMPSLFKISNSILIKASPLLDICRACDEIKNVKNVYVVAVNNECKELLFHLENNFIDEYAIHAINLQDDTDYRFTFFASDEKNTDANIDEIKKYVYEPNAAILKSGGFKSVSNAFDLHKFHMHTHLYSSDKMLDYFPGRCFEILHITKVDKKKVSTLVPCLKANVSIRNFPGTAQALKNKLGLIDGGNIYIFGTTDYLNNKILLITRKIY